MAPPPSTSPPSSLEKLCFLVAFSFSTGWVDVISLTKYGVFANMMVGNMIFLGRVLGAQGSTLYMFQDEQQTSYVFLFALVLTYSAGCTLYILTNKYWNFTAKFWAPVFVLVLLLEECVDEHDTMLHSRTRPHTRDTIQSQCTRSTWSIQMGNDDHDDEVSGLEGQPHSNSFRIRIQSHEHSDSTLSP